MLIFIYEPQKYHNAKVIFCHSTMDKLPIIESLHKEQAMPVLEKPTLKGTGFAWPVWISAAIFPRGIPGAEMYEIRSNAHQLRERLENRRNLAVPGITRPRQPAVYLARLGKLFPD